MTITATARDGETVDQICWRILGKTAGVTEQVLELNRGIAKLGPALPAGTVVYLPEPKALTTVFRETVKLWD